MSATDPTAENSSEVEIQPAKVGWREPLAKAIDVLKRKAGLQSPELGYDPNIVLLHENNGKMLGGTDMGLQLEIRFDGSRYSNAFDKTFDALLDFARKGDKWTGWTGVKNSPTWGQYAVVEVNGRKYGVVDETSQRGSGTDRVGIRADLGRESDQEKGTEGNYYFSRGTEGRKIEVCGAHMPLQEVMTDVRAIGRASEGKK